MKTKKQVFKPIFVLALTFVLFISTVSATTSLTTDPDWGNSSSAVKFNISGVNSVWEDYFKTSISNWNNSNASVNLSISSSAVNTLTASRYSDSWYGLTTRNSKDKFTIKINARTIDEDASNYTNFCYSVIVHEIGHVLCLNDFTNTSDRNNSIMNGARDRNTLIKPTKLDCDTVNSVY